MLRILTKSEPISGNPVRFALECLCGEGSGHRCSKKQKTPWICSGPPHLLGPWGRPAGRGEWPPRTATFRSATEFWANQGAIRGRLSPIQSFAPSPASLNSKRQERRLLKVLRPGVLKVLRPGGRRRAPAATWRDLRARRARQASGRKSDRPDLSQHACLVLGSPRCSTPMIRVKVASVSARIYKEETSPLRLPRSCVASKRAERKDITYAAPRCSASDNALQPVRR